MEDLDVVSGHGSLGFYLGRRVLVTGHTGFKGSWLCTWLLQLGAEVHGYSLPPPTTPSLFEITALGKHLKSHIGDVRDFDLLQTTFGAVRPEVVFHLAAQPLVRESYNTPRETIDTNVMGTVNLLECVRRTPSVRSVVAATSDKCYQDRGWDFAYRENDRLGGYDPYSASKACAEIVAAAYRKSFFEGGRRRCGIATVRAGNVIGGGDWAQDRLIPDCVRALSEGRPVVLRNPRSIRPWQHVIDPLHGYLILGAALVDDADRFEGPWNFGPAESGTLTVREIAEAFVNTWGAGGSVDAAEGDTELHETRFLRLSCDRAMTHLPWRPLLPLAEALRWTVRWYADWARGSASLRDLMCTQIAEVRERASTKS